MAAEKIVSQPFDVQAARRDFPILHQRVRGRQLVYLDNAATTQKPRAVIDRLVSYYETENANIHRGVHFLSEKATKAYEDVRQLASQFVGAAEASEIVFLRGTTEAINLVAQGWGRPQLVAGDEIPSETSASDPSAATRYRTGANESVKKTESPAMIASFTNPPPKS